jgi:glycosyltransferase involved in cell wall biosynthesis
MQQYSLKLPDVSLLVTHYNRSSSLERLLRAFENESIQFGSIVVSDDGSDQYHKAKLFSLSNQYHFRLITSEGNKGLGHCLNKGQNAITTPLTLYVQEDFVPTEKFKEAYRAAVNFLNEDKDLDIVRFFSNFRYPYLTPYKKGFSKMYLPTLGINYKKIYLYSDGPHLRRSNFLKKFGQYREHIHGDRTEYWMCISFIKNGGKGLFYDNFRSLFLHINTCEEPSRIDRPEWNSKPNFFYAAVQYIYRQLRYNFDVVSNRKGQWPSN